MNADYLKKMREMYNLTQEDLAKMLHSSRKTINSYENGTNIPKSKASLIERVFSELENRIDGGISLVSSSDIKKIERNKKTAEKIHEVQTIPLYDSVATLGLVEMIKGSEKGDVLDYISIPNLPKSDGAIFMTGDSMYPLLKSGDIVALKIINKADIIFGEMHYVEYIGADFDTEFKVVKYVKRSEKGEDFVQLVSYNQHHEPKDININQIKTIAIVNASIRYNRL